MIIKLLGPSGAGKTHAVRTIFGAADNIVPVDSCGPPGTKLKTVGYTLYTGKDRPIYVVGSYESNCGGVDTVGTAQEVMNDIDHWYPTCHIVYEGLLQSTYYGAMGQWSQKFGDDFIYAWLNTPLDVCMERLHERRRLNGTKRPLNVPQAEAKWETVAYNFNKALNKGHRTAIIEWNKPVVPQIKELLSV